MRRGTYDNAYNRNRTRTYFRSKGDGESMPAGNSWQDRAQGAAPATGNVLNARQNLFKEMTAAGPNALTPEMRAKAQSLGVSDKQFNSAAGRISTNAAITPPKVVPPPVAPAAPPDTATPPKPAAKPAAPPPVSKINGMPAGQAIAQAKVGAERSWAGKALQPAKSPIARAAAVQPSTPVSPMPSSPRPSWQQAIMPAKKPMGK